MSGPIQDGRYKIWRSREQRQLILAMDGPGSMAALGHPSDYKDFHYAETGIWIVSTVATPSNTVNLASAGAVSATVQHEGNKEYLAVNNPTEVSRHSNICIKSDDRQVWTLSPASTTRGEGGSKNEFHIRYPDQVDDQVLVVDNSLSLMFPPQLALQPLENYMSSFGLPWYFERVA